MDDITNLPDQIGSEEELEQVMTRPRPVLVEMMKGLRGRLLLLGGGGKMGPTLAGLARRAATEAGSELEVVSVSRFSESGVRRRLQDQGIGTIACDLLDRSAVAELPDAEHVIYLAGKKFGTADDPSLTWAMNTLAPANVAERYRSARIVALSTGSVYPAVPVASGGASEEHHLKPPGEYANSCIGRERIFEYYSKAQGTPTSLIRLFYALDLRYGVLVDLARWILEGKAIDLSVPAVNLIWQGDANEVILRALGECSSPPTVFNLSGRPRTVRELAEALGAALDCPVSFTGREADRALLGDVTRAYHRFGEPPTPLDAVIRWTAAWVLRGERNWSKPTHFEVTSGDY